MEETSTSMYTDILNNKCIFICLISGAQTEIPYNGLPLLIVAASAKIKIQCQSI
jgi:hypothetical protein